MKQHLFRYPEFKSRHVPSRTPIESGDSDATFEKRAFSALWRDRSRLGLKAIWRCRNQRADGILELESGETLLLEIKTTLGWGTFHAACGQMLMGRQSMEGKIHGGVILFSKFDHRWASARESKPWDQFYLHAAEIRSVMLVDGLQLIGDTLHFGPYANEASEANRAR